MKEKFINKRFTAKSSQVIYQANDIIKEYQAAGLKLTLRQLYYQFVSRDLIPNTQKQYKRLGGIISDARLAGELDWDAIEDRGRTVHNLNHGWSTPNSAMETIALAYRRKLWLKQPMHVEVWIEKEALSGVIQPICNRLRVPYLACKGYTSQSEMYDAGARISEAIVDYGKKVRIIHLGDHDPSGIDMTRDIFDRLRLFGIKNTECDCCGVTYGIDLEEAEKQREREDEYYCSPCETCCDFYWDRCEDNDEIEIDRIALNFDQVELYNPPPNPAKATDCRFEKYKQKFGEESWELDALEPTVIAMLIEDTIEDLMDHEQWEKDLAKESEERKTLKAIERRFGELPGLLGIAND